MTRSDDPIAERMTDVHHPRLERAIRHAMVIPGRDPIELRALPPASVIGDDGCAACGSPARGGEVLHAISCRIARAAVVDQARRTEGAEYLDGVDLAKLQFKMAVQILLADRHLSARKLGHLTADVRSIVMDAYVAALNQAERTISAVVSREAARIHGKIADWTRSE